MGRPRSALHTHTHTQISFRAAVEMSLVWFLWPLPISHGVLFRIALCSSPPLHIPTSVYRVLFIQEICALFSSICAMFLLFSLRLSFKFRVKCDKQASKRERGRESESESASEGGDRTLDRIRRFT